MWQVFALGFMMGLGAAAFPGPINLEVVRRSLSRGARIGAAFGFGAVSADLIYVVAISMGAAAAVSSLPHNFKALMHLAGAVLLLVLGIKALRARAPEEAEKVPGERGCGEGTRDAGGALSSFFWGLAVTLSSPTTIMYWLVVSVMAARMASEAQSVTAHLAAGVGLACSIWVAVAATVSGLFHRRLSPRIFLGVERLVGAGLCAFAIYSAYCAMRLVLG